MTASLLAKDFLLLFRVNLGIRVDNVLTFTLSLPSERYTPERALDKSSSPFASTTDALATVLLYAVSL